MAKSIRLKNNVFLDSSSIYPKLNNYNESSGTSTTNLLKNKLDWCIANIKIGEQGITFINGGWSQNSFGFGLFSKIANVYQLIYFDENFIGYCAKLWNNNYIYKKIDMNNI